MFYNTLITIRLLCVTNVTGLITDYIPVIMIIYNYINTLTVHPIDKLTLIGLRVGIHHDGSPCYIPNWLS